MAPILSRIPTDWGCTLFTIPLPTTPYAVSTSCFKLIECGVNPAVDWSALAVFLRIGFFVGEDTVFSPIRILPPGGTLEWRAGKFQVSGEPQIVPPSCITYAGSVDAYSEIFSAAIARRIPETTRVALPLSGGRDSRHILFELCKQGIRPTFCVTGRRFPPDKRDDETLAATLAAELGLPHYIVGPPAREVESLIVANLKTNMTAPRRGWKMAIVGTATGKIRVHIRWNRWRYALRRIRT